MRFSSPRRRLAVLLTLLCVCQAVGGAGVAAAVDDGAVNAQATATPTPTTANNTTVQQEDPDEVNEDGNTGAVRAYLAQKLAERLGNSAVQISQGQYEQGQSVLGDQYNDLLEKYVDVQGDTDENTAAESFEEASENQRAFANATQEYNQTYQAYLEAKQAGNTTRARELARELERLSQRVNASGQNVTRAYRQIENTTGANLANATQAVNTTVQSVRQQQQAVVAETFVRTSLSLRTNETTVSFTQPASITGTITLANGSVLANETVHIRIGQTTTTVQTDESGRFAVVYRPVQYPVGTQTLSVAFLPAETSVYLGSEASLNLTVLQTTANLSVTTDVSTVRYGEQLTVTGRAVADGVPVSGARVRVTLGSRTIGTVVTGPEGAYQLSTTLPAGVAAGAVAVEAVIVPPGRAVRSEPATTTITVKETATRLRLNVTAQSENELRVSGRLVTVDGAAVGGRSVEIRVNGTTVATMDTRADGTFERTVSVSETVGDTAVVRAVYNEPASNLGRATARARVALGEDGGNPDQSEGFPVPVEMLVGGGGALVSVLAIGWLLRRSDESSPAESAPPGTSEAVSSASASAGEVDPLEQATSLLEAGDSEAAVRALYGAVRQRLGTDAERTATHWEFFTAVTGRVDDDTARSLEQLTQAYERVVYSPGGVDSGTVSELLAEAERLLEDGDSEAAD